MATSYLSWSEMAIDSKIPEISVLKTRVEESFGVPLRVHSDFEALRNEIFSKTKEMVSETTLERLWGYSTRGYETVSRRTLKVLCAFIGVADWDAFLRMLKDEGGSESDLFDSESVKVSDIKPGYRLRIGWPPDRLCTIRYLGGNRFVAEETLNAKLQPGDTFSCLQFQLHSPLFLTDLRDASGGLKGANYGVGLRRGLTTLQILS